LTVGMPAGEEQVHHAASQSPARYENYSHSQAQCRASNAGNVLSTWHPQTLRA